jgi:transposase
VGDSDLFGAMPEVTPTEAVSSEKALGAARLLRPNREQIQFMPTNLDSLLPEDHPARMIWGIVEKLDLSMYEVTMAAREGHPGRPGIDPRILATLWLYAISDGVGSARRIERLQKEHRAYQWICGGVNVNHHALSDFRVGHFEKLNALFSQVLGVMTHEGLLELHRVAQDGMKVRASAGAASFRREKTLSKFVEEAREHVEAVARESRDEEQDGTVREQAARKRAAEDRHRRVKAALEILPQVQEVKGTRGEARVSTTDPEARVMKMPDGGFRPAYNVQLATDVKTRVIAGVEVTNIGSDRSQMLPMLANIKERVHRLPKELLVDGGYAKKQSIEEVTKQGVTVFAPVLKPKEGIDPHLPKRDDTPEVAEWRQRMGTPEAKEIYKDRAATAETTNADLKVNRALDRLTVRGIRKVHSVVLWAALAYNILRVISLGS